MRVAVIHNASVPSDRPDEKDVLVQTEVVCAALKALGHRTEAVACTLDLDRIQRWIVRFAPDVVFNLVESLDGKGRLIHLFPFLLDAMGIPYTGAPAESILATSNKVKAKQHMSAAGIPTPEWIELHPAGDHGGRGEAEGARKDTTWILKSIWEHASLGIDETGIVQTQTTAEIPALLRLRSSGPGGICFAERFIDGREFNLSLLAGPCGPEILPPAEIIFQNYDAGRPRIVGYRAKWDDASFEFHHTPRRFEFSREDADLLAALRTSALTCWETFGLKGYARVDFRVDPLGRPWVLEVNANPCLSPDAGFAVALAKAGVPFSEAVRRIVEDSRPQPPAQETRCLKNTLPLKSATGRPGERRQ